MPLARLLALALVALLGIAGFTVGSAEAAATMSAAPAHDDDHDDDRDDDCSEGPGDNCAGDDCGDCLPGVGCRCHTPTGLAVACSSVPLATISAHAVACPIASTRAHANPDPFEILHVPRRAA